MDARGGRPNPPMPSLLSLRFRRRAVWIAAALASAILATLSISLTLFDDDPAPAIEAASVPQAVFAQFGETADTVFAAAIDSVADPDEVTTIAHAEGWGIVGAVSPDGRWLAYTVLPSEGRLPYRDAEAHLLSLTGGGDRLVAEGVDLQVQPVWSTNGDRVAFVRGFAPEDETGSFTLIVAAISGGVEERGPVEGVLAAHPAGFAPEGDALYVALTTPAGTSLEAVDASGGRTSIAPLSTSIARDLTLSPDGRSLAYVDASSDAPGGLQVRVVDLAGGLAASAAPDASASGPTLGPAWTPDGDLTFGVGRPGSDAVRLEGSGLSAPAADGANDGFDVPIAWAPDGSVLAVQQVTGEVGAVRDVSLALVAGATGRQPFGNADTKFLGWVPSG